jgi:peptidoglycan hydrolase-like protein with peptidoglycan-binding domain
MPLFRATVKSTRVTNGVRLEKGMSVDFPSSYGAPLSTNGGKEVIEAFQRKYGVDIKKAGAVSSAYIEVVKVG